MIRTRECGSPSTFATSRKCSMTCVATRIVITPFSSSHATPASGSMKAWSMKGVRYVRSTTTSASRNPASTSPLRIFQREITFPVGSSWGASGRAAASGSKTPGRSSYSTVTRRAASSAASSVSAATSATGSPRKRTISSARTCVRARRGPTVVVWPGTSLKSTLCGTSRAVRTHRTPGTPSAAAVSIRRRRADGRDARTTFAWSMPPIAKSSA